MSHERLIRKHFAAQAEHLEDRRYAFGRSDVLDWIRAHAPADGAATLLDVAGGTGQVARAYAQDVDAAVVVDLTPELLRRGREAGVRNVVFMHGDARALPYLDGSFELVVCRFAIHHFDDPARAVGEMVRVCAGRLVVVDLVAGNDRYERVRDPSHVRALPVDELVGLVQAAGARVADRAERDEPVDLERWLDVTATPEPARSELRSALQAELDGGPATGMRPHVRDGALRYTQRWALLAAHVS